jgi:hypothetical protein
MFVVVEPSMSVVLFGLSAWANCCERAVEEELLSWRKMKEDETGFGLPILMKRRRGG